MIDIQQQIGTIYLGEPKKVIGDVSRDFLLKVVGNRNGDILDKELIRGVLKEIDEVKFESRETALEYACRTFHLAKEINFVEGIIRSGIHLGNLYWFKADFKISLEYFQLALHYNETFKDQLCEGGIQKGIGNYYLRVGFLKEALKHYTNSVNIYKALGDENQCGSLYNNMGIVYKDEGDYEKALSYYLKSLNIKKNSGDFNALANVYLNIGILNDIQKEHENALKYFKKILELPSDKLDDIILASAYNSVGQTYVELGDNINALNYIYKSLNINKKIENKSGMTHSYQEIGRVLEANKEYGAATVNYEQALKISREIGSLSDEANCLHCLGQLNYQIQNYLTAEQQLKKSYVMSEAMNHKPKLIDIGQLLADLHYKTNRFRESCDYMKQVYKLQVELSDEEKTRILVETKTRFELQQRDLEIEKLSVKQEMLLKANQELELFAGKAAHDLKEPLRMMSSFSSLLHRKYGNQLDTSGQEFIGHIHEGAKRMEKLLTDMLTFAKSGADPSQSVEVNLNDILHIVKSNLRLIIEEKNAEIQCDELPMVKAANVAMIQLLQNIIANALKFTKSDIASKINMRYVTRGDNFYQISIADNGIGIPKAQTEKVFIIFQRVHKRGDYEGSGIGLATCKKIVECLGGKIWLESVEGEGTTFHFLLPKI